MEQEMIGQSYHELTVIKIINKPDTNKYKSWNTCIWVECNCSCGKTIQVPWYGVKNGLIRSCGHTKIYTGIKNLDKYRENNPPANSIYLTYNNKTMNISDWSKETNIPRTTIMYRLSRDLPIEKILERRNDNE